jgi:hypothetical protein
MVPSNHELLWPTVERWQCEARETGRLEVDRGRPTIAMEAFGRLWCSSCVAAGISNFGGGETDSVHLRRFCLISLTKRVPDASTVRKLARRSGAGGGD